MESETEEISPEQKRRLDWLNRLFAEFEKLGPFTTGPNLPDGECPSWVAHLERVVGGLSFPGAQLKTSKVRTPSLIGAVLGQQCAYAVWGRDWLNTQREPVNTEASRDASDKRFSDLRRLAKRALCSSVDQSYEDMSEFLLAYAAAFAKKPEGKIGGEIGSTTIEIYFFLLWNWRAVRGLKSVRQLHEVLVKYVGKRETGNPERIVKICQRIGLSFRKPGRPRKPK